MQDVTCTTVCRVFYFKAWWWLEKSLPHWFQWFYKQMMENPRDKLPHNVTTIVLQLSTTVLLVQVDKKFHFTCSWHVSSGHSKQSVCCTMIDLLLTCVKRCEKSKKAIRFRSLETFSIIYLQIVFIWVRFLEKYPKTFNTQTYENDLLVYSTKRFFLKMTLIWWKTLLFVIGIRPRTFLDVVKILKSWQLKLVNISHNIRMDKDLRFLHDKKIIFLDTFVSQILTPLFLQKK